MAAFKTIGNLLDSSGWTGALVQANVATPGTAESFLCVNHVMRTRRAHQITASSLYHLLQRAYLAHCSSLGEEHNQSPVEDWCSSRAELYQQFKLWLLLLQLELAVLVYVRAIREGDFKLYEDALTKIAPWFFALDHTYYA